MNEAVQMTVRKIGNSIGFTLPASLRERLGLEIGQVLEARTNDGDLVLAVPKRPRYTRAELLAQCDASAPVPEDMRAWDRVRPVGNEII